MIPADDSTLVREIGCDWNRNSDEIAIGDVLAAQFDACAAPHGIRAWNGPPNEEKASFDASIVYSVYFEISKYTCSVL